MSRCNGGRCGCVCRAIVCCALGAFVCVFVGRICPECLLLWPRPKKTDDTCIAELDEMMQWAVDNLETLRHRRGSSFVNKLRQLRKGAELQFYNRLTKYALAA